MKVILLEDIKGTGKKGQVLEVSAGHARNYLVPKKLAIEATKTNINELEGKAKSEENKKQKQLEEARELSKELESKTINLSVKVGANGKLFGAVTTKEISAAIKEKTDINIDKKKLVISDNINSIGEHIIEVKLHPKVISKIKLTISKA